MTTSFQPFLVALFLVILVVFGCTAALPGSVSYPAVKLLSLRGNIDTRRPPPADDIRRPSRRHATADDVRAMFTGLDDADRQKRLMQLAKLDFVAAVLEYNEMVLMNAAGNDSQSRTCWMRLNYNITRSPQGLTDLFRDQVQNVLQTANSLNNALLTTGDSALSDSLYQALVTGLVGSDPLVYGAVIVLDPVYADVSSARRAPYVFRNSSTNKLQVQYVDVVRDTVRELRGQQPGSANSSDEFSWFWRQRENHFSQLRWPRRTVCNRNRTAAVGQQMSPAAAADSAVSVETTVAESFWGVPKFDCARARSWIVAFSVPFFGCTSQRELAFKGVLKVDMNLGSVDIDQCATDSRHLFDDSHRCPSVMQCVHIPDRGFRRGSYRCECPASRLRLFGSSTRSSNGSEVVADEIGLDGAELEKAYVDSLLSGVVGPPVRCPSCERGCPGVPCSDERACMAEYDPLMRGIPMGVQSLCITVTIILTIVIFRLRKTKVMKASFWCFLEAILVGSLMLYSTVVVQYFEPTQSSCLLIPWLREVGFCIIYGALLLKVYRVLAEFQSRKAHRVQIRDRDLFKYLCCILVIVIGYMSAWTAVTLDYIGRRGSILQTGITADKFVYIVCQSKWWDYVIETAELLFMCFAMYLCYCTRAAPSNYREIRYISWAIYNETIVSAVFYVTRHVFWLSIHPDYIFMMYFARCQLTVSVMLILILAPKLWYSRHPGDDDMLRGRAYSACEGHDTTASTPAVASGPGVEASKFNPPLNLNGDVDIGDINLSEMNPDDIRSELKRLYTQLQIYKTKTMRQDNPHISKRRGGRKQTHRRFSLQAFHNKHKLHHASTSGPSTSGSGLGGAGGSSRGEHCSIIGGETEVSRSPEDSMNSAEGVSVYAEESTADVRSPSVAFKPAHKSRHAS